MVDTFLSVQKTTQTKRHTGRCIVNCLLRWQCKSEDFSIWSMYLAFLILLSCSWSHVLILSIDDIFPRCWFKDLTNQNVLVTWSKIPTIEVIPIENAPQYLICTEWNIQHNSYYSHISSGNRPFPLIDFVSMQNLAGMTDDLLAEASLWVLENIFKSYFLRRHVPIYSDLALLSNAFIQCRSFSMTTICFTLWHIIYCKIRICGNCYATFWMLANQKAWLPK